MANPYEVLGISAASSAEEIKEAYRALVKRFHPDRFPQGEAQEAAQARMVALNLAYEEALHLAQHRSVPACALDIPTEDAMELCRRMLRQGNPRSALRQLLRAEHKTASWFALQGDVLMAMEEYASAQQAYRAAVRMEPDNIAFRRGALDASVAQRKAESLSGRVKKLFRRRQSGA